MLGYATWLGDVSTWSAVRMFTISGWDFVLGSLGGGFLGGAEVGVGLEAARGGGGLVRGGEGGVGFVLGEEGEEERGEPP